MILLNTRSPFSIFLSLLVSFQVYLWWSILISRGLQVSNQKPRQTKFGFYLYIRLQMRGKKLSAIFFILLVPSQISIILCRLLLNSGRSMDFLRPNCLFPKRRRPRSFGPSTRSSLVKASPMIKSSALSPLWRWHFFASNIHSLFGLWENVGNYTGLRKDWTLS